jgi:hypothetical protein
VVPGLRWLPIGSFFFLLASLVRTDQRFHAHDNELVRKKEFDVARWNDAFTRREQSYLRKLGIFVVVEGTAIDSPPRVGFPRPSPTLWRAPFDGTWSGMLSDVCKQKKQVLQLFRQASR